MNKDRGIDHIVLAVRDLDAARAFYQRLGFNLTPLGVHPWGTANFLAQLQGNFIEVLHVNDPAKIVPPAPGQFSFGAFNAAFLKRRQGFSMLVFQSKNARRDQAEFKEAGLDTYAPFEFARMAKLPDGKEAKVAFSLAFATHRGMPEAAFFTCQQHAPQYFWKPEYQKHANGARTITEVVMRGTDPIAFADFFGRLQGKDAVRMGDGRLEAQTALGKIVLLNPAVAAKRFPGMQFGGDGVRPAFIAYRVAVADLAATETLLRKNEVPHLRQGQVLTVAPKDAFGVAIEFAYQ